MNGRTCIAVLAVLVAASAAAAAPAEAPSDGRLKARPQETVPASARGLQRLVHDGLLYVPSRYSRKRPSVLVVALHGAGSGPIEAIGHMHPFADEAGLILLAPKSRGGTWDAIRGDFGVDVATLDELLRTVFARYAVDPDRVFISGFSDGASYALSLGLTNGDLFEGIVAFSPGFAGPAALRGKPRIFVSHGTRDSVLPIDATSRRLVPELRRRGYAVTYREFAGPHAVPTAIARRAVAWLGTR